MRRHSGRACCRRWSWSATPGATLLQPSCSWGLSTCLLVSDLDVRANYEVLIPGHGLMLRAAACSASYMVLVVGSGSRASDGGCLGGAQRQLHVLRVSDSAPGRLAASRVWCAWARVRMHSALAISSCSATLHSFLGTLDSASALLLWSKACVMPCTYSHMQVRDWMIYIAAGCIC